MGEKTGGMMVVKFVRQSTEPSAIMQQTFEECSSSDGNCVWVTEDDCLQIQQRERKSVFIFEKFEGASFENITATNNRIYGPMCILTCMRNGDQLPKLSHPVFSLALRGLTISCTSVEKAHREQLHQQIQWMCGTVSKDFNENVTHLIAGEVGSKKYLVAANLKRKIMLPEWVDELWKASHIRFVHGDDADFSQFTCPVFKGFVITVSGLETKERAELKELVEREGGRYTGEMKMNECTHLVLHQPKGQKFEFARKWKKIHIVSPKWLYDSADSGYTMEEHRYRVDGSSQSSGDNQQMSTSTPDKRTENRLSNLPDVSAISMTHINDTAMTLPDHSRMSVQIDPPDELDRLNLSTYKADMFLDGCKIFLTGFNNARMDKFRRIINLGGGTRFNQLNENVTHVVMGEQVKDHVQQLRQAATRPYVVNSHWLVDCLKQGQHLGEEPYICLELAPLEPQSPLVKGKKAAASRLSQPPKPPPSQPAVPEQPEAGPDDDMQDLMSQYLTGNNTDESALIRAAEMGEGQASHPQPPAPSQDDDATQDPNSDETLEPATQDEDAPLFLGKTMVIFGFNPEDEQQLVSFIHEAGGRVLQPTSRKVPDYAVVPVFGCPVNITVGDIVTNTWLQMCMEKEELLPLDSNELFSPVVLHRDAVPLEGCVLSISGYAGTERDTLMHIAEECGAKCQEFFVKKANNELDASTHLIVNAPEGSKYNAAKKWKLPAVTKYWLFACGRSGERLPESDYLVDNPPKPADGSSQNKTITASDNRAVANTSHNTPSTRRSSQPPPAEPMDTSPTHERSRSRRSSQIHDNNEANQSRRSSSTNEKDMTGEMTAALEDPDATMDEGNEHHAADLDGSRDGEVSLATAPRHDVTGDLDATSHDASRHGALVPEDVVERMEAAEEEDEDDEIVINVKAAEGDVSLYNDKEQVSPSTDKSPVDKNKENLMGPPTKRTPIVTPKAAMVPKDATPRLANLRVKTLINENKPLTPQQSSTDKAGIDTPSKFLGPNTVFIPNYNLTDAMSALDTPAAEKKKKRSSLPLEELFKHHIAIALKNTAAPGSHQPATASPMPVPVDDSVLKQEPVGPLQGVVIAVSKKLSSKQSEYNDIASSLGAEYRWTFDESCTHFIFQGRNNDINKEFRKARDKGKTIVSPHWLLMCQEQKCLVDETLFPHTYNPNMSLAFEPLETPVRSTRRSTRATRSTKVDISTSPTPCPQGKLSFNESPKATKPSTPNKPSTSHQLKSPETKKSTDGATSKVDLDATASDEEMAAAVETAEKMVASMKVTPSKEKSEAKSESMVNDLKNLMANTKTYNKGRRRSRRTDSVDANNSMLEDGAENKRANLSGSSTRSKGGKKDDDARRNSRTSIRSRLAQGVAETQIDTASQMVVVSWDDPMAREQQVMMASELAKNSESFSPTRHQDPSDDNQHTSSDDDIHSKFRVQRKERAAEVVEEDQRIPTPEPPTLAFPIPKSHKADPVPMELRLEEEETEEKKTTVLPIFLLSGMAQQERDDYGALVEQLGGQMSDASFYDGKCTHLVVGNPTRNEKYLACVAAGKWVLHKSFFEACRAENKFVSEEAHEWGNEGTAGIMSGMSAASCKLAKAAHRWRVKTQQMQESNANNMGAFEGWNVVLLTDQRREDGFRRLLQAGGATVVATRPPVENLGDVTHAFMDLAKVGVEVDVEAYVNAGVLCLRPEYIASYLMDDPSPSPRSYYIQEVQALMKSQSRKRKQSSMGTPSGKRSRHR